MSKATDRLSGSHLPILSQLVNKTNGPVLELGAGYNSTPLLYWICKAEGRKFVSYENDKGWVDQLSYPVKYIEDWDKADIDDEFWSVVLIDHRPALRRKDDARRLKNNAAFIVMHDSEPEINKFYRYTWIYDEFKYRHDFTKVKPNTTVLSNFVPPNVLLT